MIKKRKNKATMIDMSSRKNVKIVPATQEEIILMHKELEEVSTAVEKRMERYESDIRELFISVSHEEIITVTEDDASYFISKYEDMIKNRNSKNISNRIKQYQFFLEENV